MCQGSPFALSRVWWRSLSWLLLLLLGACRWEDWPEWGKKIFPSQSSQASRPLVVALSWKRGSESALFFEGAELAAHEINSAGGVLGRWLKTVRHDDEDKREDMVVAARNLAADPDLVAVIGHASSSVAAVSSVVYEYRKVVFIAPAATSNDLTVHDFKYVFRIIPDNKALAGFVANFCQNEGWQRMAIIHTRDDYGSELGESFRKDAVKRGIRLIARISFPRNRTNVRDLVSSLRGESLDAIFFGGTGDDAARLLIQLREMGIQTPLIGGDGLVTPKLWSLAGPAANGTVMPTVLQLANPQAVIFTGHFYDRYHVTPTEWSAMGYDAVNLLVHAMQIGQVVNPTVVATILRYMPLWKGVTGDHQFSKTGNILRKQVYFKELYRGKFYLIPE